MAFDDELETTLRIKVDQREVDELAKQLAKGFESHIAEALRRTVGGLGGGGGSSGGSTTSTTSHGATGAAASGAGSHAAPAPGSTTISSGGGGGHPGRDARGRFLPGGGAGSGIDYSRYINGYSGHGDRLTRAVLSGAGNSNPLSGAVSGGAMWFGDRMIDDAKERARYIDQMGGGPNGPGGGGGFGGAAMGFLANAPMLAKVAAFAANYAGKHMENGSDLQEQYSRKYGAMGSRIAEMGRGGGFRAPGGGVYRSASDYFKAAARIGNGAIDPDEALSRGVGYTQAAGFNDTNPLDFLRLANTGVSAEAIGTYHGNQRLGARGADPERFIGAGQSAGLMSNVIESLLYQVASNTRAMSVRGVKVDMSAFSEIMERAVANGTPPEIAMTAANNVSSGAMSLAERDRDVFRPLAEAQLRFKAMQRGGRSFKGFISAEEEQGADPRLAYSDLSELGGEMGELASSAMGRTSVNYDPRSIMNKRGGANRAGTLDEYQGADGAMGYGVIPALQEALRYSYLQSRDFQAQKASTGGMSDDYKDMRDAYGTLARAVEGLKTSLDRATGGVTPEQMGTPEIIRAINGLRGNAIRGGADAP